MKVAKLLPAIWLISCLGYAQINDNSSPSHGLLWKISGNGLTKPSYLFGTYHAAGGAQILDTIPAIKSLIVSTEQMVAETNFANALKSLILKKNKIKSKSPDIFKPWPKADSTYAKLLSVSDKKQLESIVAKDKALAYLYKMNYRPFLLMSFYLRTKSRDSIRTDKKAIPERDTTITILDFHLQRMAGKNNKPIAELETIAEHSAMNTQFFTNNKVAKISYKQEAEMLMNSIRNYAKIDSLKKVEKNRLLNLYLNQDIAEFSSMTVDKSSDFIDYDNESLTKKYMLLLIDKRNSLWVKKLPGLIQTKSSFIEVGVAHLPGENGLISLLRKQGYTVENVK